MEELQNGRGCRCLKKQMEKWASEKGQTEEWRNGGMDLKKLLIKTTSRDFGEIKPPRKNLCEVVGRGMNNAIDQVIFPHQQQQQ